MTEFRVYTGTTFIVDAQSLDEAIEHVTLLKDQRVVREETLMGNTFTSSEAYIEDVMIRERTTRTMNQHDFPQRTHGLPSRNAYGQD